MLENLKLLESFLENLAAERGAAPNTLLSYSRDLHEFHTFILPKSFKEVDSQDISDYLNKLTSQHLAATTQARRISALRQFYNFLLSEELITDTPMAMTRLPKTQRSLPKYLTYDEVERLLSCLISDQGPQQIRLKAMLELLYATGLRVSELVSLPYAVLEADSEILKQRSMIFIKGKGGRERMVPLSDYAIDAVSDYMAIRATFLERLPKKAAHWLFPSRGAQGHLTRHRFYQLIKEVALKAGIDPQKVSPHVIRHAFATHLLQGGADLLSIQKLLGHADIATTQIYTHVAVDQVVNLVTTHHPLAKKIK